MTEEGADYARRPGRGPAPGLRRARPHRRRRGLRRRRQGGHHRHASPSAARVVAGDVYHEGISRHHRRRHRRRRTASATSSSCWPSAEQDAGSAAVGRAGPPGDGARRSTRWPACATATTPCSWRATPSASSCSTAGAPAACRRPAPCSATSSTPPSTCARAPTRSLGTFGRARIRPIDETTAEYYLPLEVARPARRAPRRHRRVRPPRREHPRRGAGGPGRRRPPRVHHPRGPGGRRAGHAAGAARARRGAAGRRPAAGHRLRECASAGRCATSPPAGRAPELGFADVLLAGLATDGGLYVPAEWPALPALRRPAPATPPPPPPSWRPYVERRHRAGRRSSRIVRRRLRDVRPPRRVPARPARRRRVAARAVPRPDPGLQGRGPAARRAAVRPRARPRGASG